jgi:hypothetical protein
LLDCKDDLWFCEFWCFHSANLHVCHHFTTPKNSTFNRFTFLGGGQYHNIIIALKQY